MLGFSSFGGLPLGEDELSAELAVRLAQVNASGGNALSSLTGGDQPLSTPGGQPPLSTSVGGDQPLQVN